MKTALVTGASRGIGKAIAEKLKADNYKVIGTATSDSGVDTLNSNGIEGHLLDLNSKDSIENFWSKLESDNKTISVLVNNAGITQDNLAIRMSLEEWKKVIDINLTSTFLMSKSAIKKMLKNKSGRIVNITSVVGHTGNLGQANYTASKAGIIAMSKSLAIEYAKKNININCISPGFIKTAMTDKLDEKFKEAIISKIPSARLGDPDDVANAVVFLC